MREPDVKIEIDMDIRCPLCGKMGAFANGKSCLWCVNRALKKLIREQNKTRGRTR